MTILSAVILGVGLLFNAQAASPPDDGEVLAAEAEPIQADEVEGEDAEASESDATEDDEVAVAEEAGEEGSEADASADAEDAKDEVAVEADVAAPVPAPDPAVEADVAEPVSETAEDAAEVAEADLEAAEDEDDEDAAPGRPWRLTIGNTIGFGLQIDDTTKYYYGQLSAGGSYRIHGPLRVGANVGLYYTPDSRPRDARQLDLGGASVTLTHGNIYHDETYTGVRISGRATVAFPFSMGGRAYGNYPTVGGGVTMARSVGPVNLSYGLTFNKFNPKSQIRYLPLCAEDRGAIDYCVGGYETNWQMGHQISASYSPIDDLSISGSFGTTLTRSFAPSRHDPSMTPDYMHDVTANIRDGFSFGLSASYEIIDSLSASLSFRNGGPWRSNGQDLYNPVFDSRLAAMSVGVNYTY